ncbi:phage tail assembly chaperone GT [Halalkalibacillus sediminis]|nr:hypothetical protein [Halalkalibacillus sediminis]
MDRWILKWMKNGKDINEVLNMPYYFVINLLGEDEKPDEKTSLIAAFGG